MKKFVSMLLAVVTLFCTACSAESKANPEFYTPCLDFLVELEQISEEPASEGSATTTIGNELSHSEMEKATSLISLIH